MGDIIDELFPLTDDQKRFDAPELPPPLNETPILSKKTEAESKQRENVNKNTLIRENDKVREREERKPTQKELDIDSDEEDEERGDVFTFLLNGDMNKHDIKHYYDAGLITEEEAKKAIKNIEHIDRVKEINNKMDLLRNINGFRPAREIGLIFTALAQPDDNDELYAN